LKTLLTSKGGARLQTDFKLQGPQKSSFGGKSAEGGCDIARLGNNDPQNDRPRRTSNSASAIPSCQETRQYDIITEGARGTKGKAIIGKKKERGGCGNETGKNRIRKSSLYRKPGEVKKTRTSIKRAQDLKESEGGGSKKIKRCLLKRGAADQSKKKNCSLSNAKGELSLERRMSLRRCPPGQ